MYLLDTNHCSRIILGDTKLLTDLQTRLSAGVSTSTIVRGELLYMVYKSQQREANLPNFLAFLQTMALYPINKEISDVYGKLKGDIILQLGPKDPKERRGFTVQRLGFGENDLWIAATVIHYNLTLISADRDFVRIQQVQPFRLESWL
jgi:tRNA(fMet)-specific endonuclease VapC